MASPLSPGRMPSLRHRHFRNYVVASFISNLGGQIQAWTLIWHLFHLTGSSYYVGMVGLVRVVPLLLFGLFGGVLADRYDRRKILLVTQFFMSLTAVGLGALTISGHASPLGLYAFVAVEAIARAYNGPVQQALVPNLVPPEDFPNAASVNGIQWRLSDVLGPACAGFLLAWHGVGMFSGLSLCYLFNAFSFVPVILVIVTLPKRPLPPITAKGPKEVVRQMREGFQFVGRKHVLRNAMFIDFWATFLSGANALLPAFAGPILKLGPTGYGTLASSIGVGALAASLFLAVTPTIRRQGATVIAMIAAYGVFTVLFGISPNLWTACLFLAGTGAADMISTVMRQTIRQLATPDSMRGRMSSIGMLFQISGPQLGDYEAGTVAHLTGERIAVVIGGVGSLVVSAWYWLRGPALRDYEHEGGGG